MVMMVAGGGGRRRGRRGVEVERPAGLRHRRGTARCDSW
jgi:hypothetical protein